MPPRKCAGGATARYCWGKVSIYFDEKVAQGHTGSTGFTRVTIPRGLECCTKFQNDWTLARSCVCVSEDRRFRNGDTWPPGHTPIACINPELQPAARKVEVGSKLNSSLNHRMTRLSAIISGPGRANRILLGCCLHLCRTFRLSRDSSSELLFVEADAEAYANN